MYGAPGSSPPPETTRPCSACTLREIHNFRQVLFAKPDGCSCPDPPPEPPAGKDCPAGAPGKIGCDCWCQDAAQMSLLCGLDPDPATFPGPCILDRMFNQSRNHEFTAICDPATGGYYATVACGDHAPPALPPSPPMPPYNPPATPPPALTAAAAVAGGGGGQRRGLQPGRKGACWCVEPSYGIQNGTSAVAHPDGARPPPMDCTETVQCELLNEKACGAFAAYCNWTLVPFDDGHICGPISGRGPHS